MQSFVRHLTGPDERMILLARLHWIYGLTGFLWMAGLVALGMGLDGFLWRHFGSTIPFYVVDVLGTGVSPDLPVMLFLFGGCGVMIFVMYMIKMLATEVALTNERIIYKTGLIFVEVDELDLVEIRSERVHHGFLGRFLGYGSIRLDSRFVGDVSLPAVKKPYRLIKALHKARSKILDPLEGAHSPSMTAIEQEFG